MKTVQEELALFSLEAFQYLIKMRESEFLQTDSDRTKRNGFKLKEEIFR